MAKTQTMTAPQLARELGMDPKRLRRRLRSWGYGHGNDDFMTAGRYVLTAAQCAEIRQRIKTKSTDDKTVAAKPAATKTAKRRTRRAAKSKS